MLSDPTLTTRRSFLLSRFHASSYRNIAQSCLPQFSPQGSDTLELGSKGQKQDPGAWLGLHLPWELGYQICHSSPSPFLGVTAQDREGRGGQGRLLKVRPLVCLAAPFWPSEGQEFSNFSPLWAGGETERWGPSFTWPLGYSEFLCVQRFRNSNNK